MKSLPDTFPRPNLWIASWSASARKAVGDKGLVNPCTHGAFNTLAQFRKLEDVMMDPINR